MTKTTLNQLSSKETQLILDVLNRERYPKSVRDIRSKLILTGRKIPEYLITRSLRGLLSEGKVHFRGGRWTSEKIKKQLDTLKNSLSKVKTCGELEKLSLINEAYTTTNLGNFLVGELSSKLREIVMQSKIGIPNNPTKQDREISTITVCNRTTPPSNIPDDESVLRNLRGKKIESMARKYLRNLRQRAFVEKRL